MKNNTFDLIEKWKVLCGLRGETVFDGSDRSYEIYNLIDQLESLEALRKSKDSAFACAEEFIRMGLTTSHHSDYEDWLSDEEDRKIKAAIKAEIDSNLLIIELKEKYKFRETTSKKWQRSFEIDVVTDTEGTFAIKGRIVTPMWGKRRVWTDYKTAVSKNVIHKNVEYNSYNKPAIDRRFPDCFKNRDQWRTFEDDYDIYVYAYTAAKLAESTYSNPKPRKAKNGKTTV